MALASPLAYRALDANGDPVSGAKLYFFDAGTTTPRNVYSDAGLSSLISQPVVANAAGWFQAIFIDGTAGDYKDRLHDADDVELRPDIDNVAPPVAGTVPVTQGGTGATTAAGARSALSVPSQAQHDAVDTRVTAAEATIANYLDASTPAITWASTTNLDHSAQSFFPVTLGGATSFTVSNLRDGGWIELLITQDGTGGRTAAFSADFVFLDGTPIVDQTAGAKTLIHGVVISGVVYAYVVNAVPNWDYVCFNQQSSGTDGGTATTGGWNNVVLNTATQDRFGLGNPTSNVIAITAGVWEAEWLCPFFQVGLVQTRLYDDTTPEAIALGMITEASTGDGSQSVSTGYARFSVSSGINLALEYQCSNTKATTGLGQAGSFDSERYASLKLRKVASL